MSITDELRGFANSGMSAMECSAYSDKLIDIADRIDKTHEEELGRINLENETLRILSLTSLRVICNHCVLLHSSACSICLVEDALSKLRDQTEKEEEY